MESVFAQNFPHYEYIIIDGGSTDGSKEMIEQNADKLAYWVSEKDKGIYNAQNKGIIKAKGDYLLFLNSGDFFMESFVTEFLIKNSEEKDIVYGDILYKGNFEEKLVISPDILDLQYLFTNTIPHPCTIIRKSLFDNVGLYNEEIKICADWAFFLDSLVKYNATYKHLHKIITVYELGGISSQINSREQIEKERLNYLKEKYSLILHENQKVLVLEQKIKLLHKSRLIKYIQKIYPSFLEHVI